jgi:hypothetical protein
MVCLVVVLQPPLEMLPSWTSAQERGLGRQRPLPRAESLSDAHNQSVKPLFGEHIFVTKSRLACVLPSRESLWPTSPRRLFRWMAVGIDRRRRNKKRPPMYYEPLCTDLLSCRYPASRACTSSPGYMCAYTCIYARSRQGNNNNNSNDTLSSQGREKSRPRLAPHLMPANLQ